MNRPTGSLLHHESHSKECFPIFVQNISIFQHTHTHIYIYHFIHLRYTKKQEDCTFINLFHAT
jgi:hypothetical protein